MGRASSGSEAPRVQSWDRGMEGGIGVGVLGGGMERFRVERKGLAAAMAARREEV